MLSAWAVIGVGNGLSNIVSTSLVQVLTPARLLGRVSAASLALGWGIAPLGALGGGAMGQVAGVRTTLLVAAIGILATATWLTASPLRVLRDATAPPTIEGRA